MENKIINNLTSEKEIKNILGCLIFQDFIKEETKVEDIRKFVELQYEKIMKVFEDAPVLEELEKKEEKIKDCKTCHNLIFPKGGPRECKVGENLAIGQYRQCNRWEEKKVDVVNRSFCFDCGYYDRKEERCLKTGVKKSMEVTKMSVCVLYEEENTCHVCGTCKQYHQSKEAGLTIGTCPKKTPPEFTTWDSIGRNKTDCKYWERR